ncbi:hypothetical protein [Hymenobacter negativus]|uniref:DUF2335 domain-containing protein n=1 Tax=Hymenobacter negativus TaxID=2795026 RepID=A0ABS3QEN4_9BACT|nr:hypothetical protein [Hymenobacter negativus]MBO2009190.1 hypothetical protein [Hymenobacter negativus]
MSTNNRGLQQNRPSTPQAPVQVTPELLDQFITNQGKQIDNERREQEIKLKELEYNDRYAQAALQAQVSDRADARRHTLDMKKLRYNKYTTAGIVVAVLGGGSLIGLTAFGHAELAELIITKIGPPVVTGVLGILGGYSAGQQKGRKQAQDEQAEAAAAK